MILVPMVGVVDEPRAQPRLDPADGFRDGGFGKIQLRRRAGEVAKFHDLGEDRQAFAVRQFGHIKKWKQ